MQAEEKGKVTLECETRRPAKRVTWLKGMIELRSSRKYVIRQKGVVLSLTITCLEKSDTDIYICDVGTMQSRAQMTVQGETTKKKTLFCISMFFSWAQMVVGLHKDRSLYEMIVSSVVGYILG